VEDQRHSREGLRLWLLARGHHIETASDGWQALRKIKDEHFDAAIIDLDLPPIMGTPLSGWDLVRILRAYAEDTAVIVVTGGDGTVPVGRAKALRVDAVMEKPIRPGQLRAILEIISPAGPVARREAMAAGC
jgi:DNA-binding response OmpR family regulator